MSKGRIILIDADVVSHFITGNEIDVIHLVFPGNQIYLLDKVHAELQNWPSIKIREKLSQLLSKKGPIKLMPFPEDNEEVKKEYFHIKNLQFKGDGESACLAVARFGKNILASSNLKDIQHYCTLHKIDYLTTMDFLCEAKKIQLFNDERCDKFIEAVRASGSKLPCKKMAEFNCRNLASIFIS